MANSEHLEILRRGVRVWNKWREEHLDILPNLSHAVLVKQVLNGMNLSGANLLRADLQSAYLEGSNLTRANLTQANLSRAKLKSANFQGAILIEANLSGADIRGANVRAANLTQATLTKADFTDADLQDTELYLANMLYTILDGTNLRRTSFNYVNVGLTKFINTNLSEAICLATVRHQFSSTIDVRTLYNSQGNLPEQFLQGAGIPENLITYLPSLFSSLIPIRFYSCFISFASENSRFAEKLHIDLQNKRVRCWFAPHDMKIGDKIRSQIDQSIHVHDKLLLILTKDSIASHWVEQEVETALSKERNQNRTVLFPIRLDDSVMQINMGWPALIRNSRHIGDFRKWRNPENYHKAFERLLRDLKASE